MGIWYATILNFGVPEEGFIPSADEWDPAAKAWVGMRWPGNGPIQYRSRQSFQTEAEAQGWASDNFERLSGREQTLWVDVDENPIEHV